MFEALADQRRRYLLYTLADDEPRSLLVVARRIAAWESDLPVSDVDRGAMERAYSALFHAHVPKLVELDIVDFDRETETISRGRNAEQVLTVLETTGGSDAVTLEDHARRTGAENHGK